MYVTPSMAIKIFLLFCETTYIIFFVYHNDKK